jgi:hypothetical protein
VEFMEDDQEILKEVDEILIGLNKEIYHAVGKLESKN